jgi:pimeloyl-ACP methyl ester carboxylesterase
MTAPAAADAASSPRVRLSGAVQRAELCGATRSAVVVAVGATVRARVSGSRRRIGRISRCSGSRWVPIASRRLPRRGRGVLVDTSRDGDYRVSTRGARAAYLRVGVGEIVDRPVRFSVRNVNRSKLSCPADGGTYEIAGQLVGPRRALSGSGRPAVTLYLHGVEVTSGYWRVPVPGYDLPYELAQRGHVSVIVDRLGFGASGRPVGMQVCVGSQADAAHQVVEHLHAGSYRLGGDDVGVRFERVILAGHSGGAIVAEVFSYSFGGVTALVLMGYHDQGVGPPLVTAGLQGEGPRCAAGGVPVDGTSGPPGYAFIWPSTDTWSRDTAFDPLPEVRAALRPMRQRTGCGEIISALTAAPMNSRNVSSVRLPVLLMFGKEDVLFPYSGAEAQTRSFSGSPDVTMVAFDRSGHQFFHDRLVRQVHAELSRWLKAHGG